MGFSHFHGRFSNPSPFKGEVRRGMGYICRCSNKLDPFIIRMLIWWKRDIHNEREQPNF